MQSIKTYTIIFVVRVTSIADNLNVEFALIHKEVGKRLLLFS